MPDWGYGKVLELIGENKGRVFFLHVGEKRLSMEHACLGKVEDDPASQAALNNQLEEFKVRFAKDLLTSEEFSKEVTCVPCESFSAKCELCERQSESLRIYGIGKKGQMCMCDGCRDKIMLESHDRAGIIQDVKQMEKRGKKAADKEKNSKKVKKVIRK
jgi:hypothetical protein